MVIFKFNKVTLIGLMCCLALCSSTAYAAANQRTTDVSSAISQNAADVKLNVNKASLQQLMAIKGLGQVRAQAILDYIKMHGDLVSLDELTEIKGIGNKLAAKVSQHLTI